MEPVSGQSADGGELPDAVDSSSREPESGIVERGRAERNAPRSARRGVAFPPGELIVEVFERMHELHFHSDLGDGLDFAVEEISRATGSGVVFIHVFDINTNEFVLVRGRGHGREDFELNRLSGKDAAFAAVLRSQEVVFGAALPEAACRASEARLRAAGAPATPSLLGPISEGGRPLGVVEVGAPDDGTYSESEVHGLDYICRQLASYLSGHPIVLDDELLRRKS